jgi:two-component system OmpR family sensor kinase
MKLHLSFRSLIIFLFIGSLIPLLVLVGLVVYRLQQSYLVNEAQRRLIEFTQNDVEQFASGTDLTVLALNLSEHLRVLGADMFIQNASGNPVPPSLGTGPWLDNLEHQTVRESKKSKVQMIGEGASARIVYLAVVIDPAGAVLGSVEASLSMDNITDQLSALERWLILIISIASGLSVLLSILLSGIITRPLRNLVESAERVRQGNLQTRAAVPEVIELGQLALTFNQMLDRISGDLNNQVKLAENMRQFAADASHELRSPLSVFRNSVDLLEKASSHNDQNQVSEILIILRKEVDAMANLVENLLLLTRLDQSEKTVEGLLHFELIDPFPILEEVYERSQLLAQGQQLELTWPTGEIAPIWADPEMLRRALNNIVENAIAHTPAGKKITLSIESQNGNCCFIITDQGCGIAPDQLPRIFERFFRNDRSRNRQNPGTGLGLAIVAAIVRNHGGDIQVESKLDEGTSFRVKFKQSDPHSKEP